MEFDSEFHKVMGSDSKLNQATGSYSELDKVMGFIIVKNFTDN